MAGADTLLSRFVVVNPISLMHEAAVLKRVGISNPFGMMRVELDALVTTPFHVSANRIRESLRRQPWTKGREWRHGHGSCGMGVGETRQDQVDGNECLYVRDLVGDQTALRAKMKRIQERKRHEMHRLTVKVLEPVTGTAIEGRPVPLAIREKVVGLDEWQTVEGDEYIDRAMGFYNAFADSTQIVGPDHLDAVMRLSNKAIIFEGAQGVLLDQDFGFQPHTTWTDITFANANALIGDKGHIVRKLGLLRAYHTRHGAGPFVSEDARFDLCSEGDHNCTGDWQGRFRSGALDLVMARYALSVIGEVDGLVMNHVDRLDIFTDEQVPVCEGYNVDGLWVESLLVRRPFNLDYQTRLTGHVSKARPVVKHVPLDGYPWRIAEMLGTSLAMIGRGPADKRILGDWGSELGEGTPRR